MLSQVAPSSGQPTPTCWPYSKCATFCHVTLALRRARGTAWGQELTNTHAEAIHEAELLLSRCLAFSTDNPVLFFRYSSCTHHQLNSTFLTDTCQNHSSSLYCGTFSWIARFMLCMTLLPTSWIFLFSRLLKPSCFPILRSLNLISTTCCNACVHMQLTQEQTEVGARGAEHAYSFWPEIQPAPNIKAKNLLHERFPIIIIVIIIILIVIIFEHPRLWQCVSQFTLPASFRRSKDHFLSAGTFSRRL